MNDNDRIRPYAHNSFYWQYKGKPVLLLGGSVEDNIFQIPDLEKHLRLLTAVGGNYLRCTMSSRDEGNVWPFEREPEGRLYDLARPGEEYWKRFQRFLELAADLDIIIQVEVWDRFDFAREPWRDNPYNPANNSNYTSGESGLVERIDSHPGRRESAFFRTVPTLEDNQCILPYQHRQVDTMLSLSLDYGNVLYCMDNETNESPEWSRYWSDYIKKKAKEAGAEVHTTEMWDAHDILAPEHDSTIEHPEIYSFIDISQNNHSPTDRHWDNPQRLRKRIVESGAIRPLNSVKIYGANTYCYGSTRDAQERFWRNIFGGLATSRFHRPPAGLGLSAIAQSHLESMRMITDQMNIFTCEPANALLSNRSWNEAYCTASPGVAYAVFFTDGGDVLLDVSETGKQPVAVRWLDIRKRAWIGDAAAVEKQGGDGRLFVHLLTPTPEGYWAALVKVLGEPTTKPGVPPGCAGSGLRQ